ncbi:MAG: rubrerythrin family protein, partial [Chloroflexi bacterium]|nr:rubrerythrin family protein [Chloroflexota bacterium]
NLRNAHAGESMAHMRYMVWGEVARKQGYANIERLFQAISFAETIHATNHFRELKHPVADSLCAAMAVFGGDSTAMNLQGAIMGEKYEIDEMYPAFLEVARFQGEEAAQRSFYFAYSGEKTHAALFEKARSYLDSAQKDMALGPVRVCSKCGWTSEGDIPENCPICNVGKDKFQTFA